MRNLLSRFRRRIGSYFGEPATVHNTAVGDFVRIAGKLETERYTLIKFLDPSEVESENNLPIFYGPEMPMMMTGPVAKVRDTVAEKDIIVYDAVFIVS